MPEAYALRFKRDAERELDRIPRANLARIMKRIHQLAFQPRPSGCKKLGEPSIYRVRQGDYRVLYQIDDENRIVAILKVGHRREVYR